MKGKGKLSHLLGIGLKEGDSEFDTWDEADSMIMLWLRNSMNSEISETYMFVSMANEIWDVVQQMYSNARYAKQVYHLNSIPV